MLSIFFSALNLSKGYKSEGELCALPMPPVAAHSKHLIDLNSLHLGTVST